MAAKESQTDPTEEQNQIQKSNAQLKKSIHEHTVLKEKVY
jgi:hypothetical protein